MNVVVVVDDPEERLKDGEEIKVNLTWCLAENTFKVTVPEIKKVEEKKDERKAIEVYQFKDSKLKGTVTKAGHVKVNIDQAPERIRDCGVSVIKSQFCELLDKTLEKAEEVAQARSEK